MKVVFLSAVPGHGATTSNMIITSVMLAVGNRYQSVLFQSGESLCGVDQYLLGESVSNNMVSELDYPFFYGKGIDALIKKVSAGKSINRDKKSILSCCMKILEEGCYLLPTTTRKNRALYNQQMNMYVQDLISWCNREFDIIFIDNKQDNQELYNRINEEADLIVINTNQSHQNFERAVRIKDSLVNKKCVIVLGKYEPQCSDNYEKLRKMYRLSSEEMLTVRYDRNFLNALMTGNAVSYIKECQTSAISIKSGIRAMRGDSYRSSETFAKSIRNFSQGFLKIMEEGVKN